jgi:hypothetical protein
MTDKILAKGIRFFTNEKQPDFVVCNVVITPNELVQFIKDNSEHLTDYNGQKQIKLQLLKSKEGKLYANIDTYKPNAAQTESKPKEFTDLPF